jgi:peptidoglycan LD-endopeptidase CwlK
MASRDLKDLTAATQVKAKKVLTLTKEKGLDLMIYCTLRSLEEQARLFRQSRSKDEIVAKMKQMQAAGFGFLADIIDAVGPCNTAAWATNAGPGESWHNYGEAFDAVPVVNGKLAWDQAAYKKQWLVYGECARAAGLEWAGDWKKAKEYPHAQNRFGENPLKTYSPDQVEELLKNAGLL